MGSRGPLLPPVCIPLIILMWSSGSEVQLTHGWVKRNGTWSNTCSELKELAMDIPIGYSCVWDRGVQELGWGARVTLKFHHRKQWLEKGWKSELGCWIGSVDQGLIIAVLNGH